MLLTIEIPDEIAQGLDQPLGSLSRRLLEMAVAEAYRSDLISTAEVRYAVRDAGALGCFSYLLV